MTEKPQTPREFLEALVQQKVPKSDGILIVLAQAALAICDSIDRQTEAMKNKP